MSRHIILLGLFFFFLASFPAEALIIETVIRVQVAGEVHRPGVYSLPVQSRVADAIQLAGGLKKGASLANLNLSSALRDGEAVAVPNEEKVKLLKAEKTEKIEKSRKKKRPRNPAHRRKKAFPSIRPPSWNSMACRASDPAWRATFSPTGKAMGGSVPSKS
ncbi:MAG TPA: SLBB domain-containing protein [Chroococcales cyanobacterium]